MPPHVWFHSIFFEFLLGIVASLLCHPVSEKTWHILMFHFSSKTFLLLPQSLPKDCRLSANIERSHGRYRCLALIPMEWYMERGSLCCRLTWSSRFYFHDCGTVRDWEFAAFGSPGNWDVDIRSFCNFKAPCGRNSSLPGEFGSQFELYDSSQKQWQKQTQVFLQSLSKHAKPGYLNK